MDSILATSLGTLSDSLYGAISSLPSQGISSEAAHDATILPPTDGISLLDTKNELFLSYLQNLVFLLLLRVRRISGNLHSQTNRWDDDRSARGDSAIEKLAELRLYLEKGIRPLEGRLKYQIDKVLKAAHDAERIRSSTGKKSTFQRIDMKGDSDLSSSESGADSDGSDNDQDQGEIDDLAYRPNLAAFAKNAQEKESASNSGNSKTADGIYRPPKIRPTALPAEFSDRRSNRDGRRASNKSRVIDEFVSAEMSEAPMAEPSIGSTIRAGGREVRTQREREIELERRAYEETNFVRLPKESKKERAKQGGKRQGGFGGEDWRSLGAGADRIERLTRLNREGGGALGRSRKRQLEDRPGSDSANIGEGFEKRRRKIAGWKK